MRLCEIVKYVVELEVCSVPGPEIAGRADYAAAAPSLILAFIEIT